jgi:hypothetical protein
MRESKKVKILEFKNEAIQAAKNLLDEAKQNEPVITELLKAIAQTANGEMVGLENKLKNERNLAEKLRNYAKKWNHSIAEEAVRNNDALRYTMIFPADKCRNGYKKVLQELEGKGYKIKKIWNAWALEGNAADSGYRGINVTLISSQSQIFELQFHTAESFHVKTETHPLYEERRNPKTSRRRDAEILEIMKKFASGIERPKGM